MKIAVMGGAGYIASHTIIELYKAGHSVVAVDKILFYLGILFLLVCHTL